MLINPSRYGQIKTKRYQKSDRLNYQSAFTIVELLVVIVVIGILASITIISYSGIATRAKIASLQSDLSNAANQLKIFNNDNGYFPISISTDCTTLPTNATNLCVKNSTGNSYTAFPYISPSKQSFIMSAANGNIAYYITENAQPTPIAKPFAKVYGGTGSDSGYSIAKTNDGGIVVAGSTDSFGAGSTDVFVVKYNADGNIIWNKTWGGAAADSANSIVQANDGGFAITGRTYNYGAGNADMVIIKLSAAGDVIWNKTWGGAAFDCGLALVQTNDGGYVVTGQTDSYGAGAADSYIAKYDPAGTLLWTKTWGGTNNENASSIIQTTDGGYAITGNTYGFGLGNAEAYLAKFTSTGATSWTKTWGSAGYEFGSALIQTNDGGYALAGMTDALGVPGGNDAFLLKFDSSGLLQWNKTWGGTGDDRGFSLFQNNDNSLIVSAGTNTFGAGGYDLALLKFASDGTFNWNRTLGGVNGDAGYSVIQSSDGNIDIAGFANGLGTGGNDILLARYYFDGTINNCSSPTCQNPSATIGNPSVSLGSPATINNSYTAGTSTPVATLGSQSITTTTIVSQ